MLTLACLRPALLSWDMPPPAEPDELRKRYDTWHAELHVDVDADAPWHRLLRPHVNRLVPSADVLEIGCGRGGYAASLWLAQPRRLVATDFSPVAVQTTAAYLASRGADPVETRIEDACSMSFANNSFDVVISCETVEHVHDPERAIREMARILRPAGSLLLSTPNYLSLTGLSRVYLRLRGRPYTEEGQPINHVVLAPKTRRWIKRAGLRVEETLADGLYLPLPRPDGPLRVPLGSWASRALRPVLLHSAFVARKPG